MPSRRKIIGVLVLGLSLGIVGAVASQALTEGDEFSHGDVLLQNHHSSGQTFALKVFRKHDGGQKKLIFENQTSLEPDEEILFENVYTELGEYRVEARTDSGYEDSHSRILLWEDPETGELTGFRTRVRLSADLGLNVNGISDDNPPIE